MPPDDDTLEEQTIAFQLGDAATPYHDQGEPVHVLLLSQEDESPRRFPLRDLPAVVGRQPPADLILDGPTVSRRHCRLDLCDGRLRIQDLGSTNGTFVNGVRLSDPVLLEDGADLAIGIHRLRYHRRGRDETADADAMDQDLREASNYVASLLPAPISEGVVRADWYYRPTTRVGGDAFGYQPLGNRHFSLFLLDVAGHGTGAAMHAMAVAHVLRERVLPDVDFHDPAAVLAGLNAMFPMERNNDLFLTIWYGVYDVMGRVLGFAAAGHHAAYLLPADPAAWAPVPLLTRNPVIGMLPHFDPIAAEVEIPPDSVLHLFSDGVFEVVDHRGRQLGLDDILPLLPEATGRDGPRRLYRSVRALARPGPLDDDFSALVFRFP